VLGPRRMIWPFFRAILPPKGEKAAHESHTWPLVRVGFIGDLVKVRLTGVQATPGGEV
jgi:hypothetical protein